jgi:hypothetical protein
MAYPTIPLEGFWSNQTSYEPQFTRVEMKAGGVVHRSRSQLINATRQSWAFQGVIQDRDPVDAFLRDRNGLPFEFQGNVYNCTQWTWSWLVFVSGIGKTQTLVGGVWELSGTFVESFNPEP